MMRFNSIFMIILLVTAICVQTALSGVTHSNILAHRNSAQSALAAQC